MSKSNLLKEAIADAKAVRETALANARLRMEEAFTPRLQSMISAKLQNEIEGENEDDDKIIDEPVEEPVDEPTEEPTEEPAEKSTEEPAEKSPEEPAEKSTEEPVEEPIELDDEEEDIEEPVEEPVEIETEPDVDIEVEPSDDETEGEGDELDLESIIKELEDESNIDDEMDEPMFTEESDKEEIIEPEDTEIGGEDELGSDFEKQSKDDISEEECEDEEINLDEILKELEDADSSASISKEIPDASNPFKSANEQLKEKISLLTKDLKEHRNVIKFLKSKLNEVNLLNAKLLFTSKLFKSNNMSNNTKMKVIESFDRAKTLREVKLVYSTIAESLNVKSFNDSKKVINKITENIGGASKPVALTRQSVKPKKVVNEGIVSEEGAERLQKLAGIKKKK